MDDIDTINHALCVERGGVDPQPSYDPDVPIDTHSSHEWSERLRWMECSRCGIRDHWPASSVRCKVPHGRASVVGREEAVEALKADLEAFSEWWFRGEHPEALPTVDEWAANFYEWRMR
jgi:hypothetical protein